jgi:hypothetical protein
MIFCRWPEAMTAAPAPVAADDPNRRIAERRDDKVRNGPRRDAPRAFEAEAPDLAVSEMPHPKAD